MFDFFNHSSRAYDRLARTMLQEARFAQLEHAAAAEHHHALATMYADRVRRLESPMLDAVLHKDQPSAELLAATPDAQRTPLRVLSQPGSQAVAG